WQILRWLSPDAALDVLAPILPTGAKIAFDAEQRPVLLFPTEWAMNYFVKQNPKVAISEVPFKAVAISAG
ncbi:MAG TPA: hypothetical protein VFC46_10265, partial [Humisphaera sp.]|nr:hypothetical protein [Humisphaera sp.]